MKKRRKELEDSNTGCDCKQVMDVIQNKTSVKYHKVHVFQLLHKLVFVRKIPQKRFTRTAFKEEKEI